MERGIPAIGYALELQVFAQGVETESPAQLLTEYGCTNAQGYLYSRALPELELIEHLRRASTG